MFDLNIYRKRLLEIKENNLLSLTDLAKWCGVSFLTLKKILDEEYDGAFSNVTLRKIKEYVEKYDGR
jgi:hypothetical protein